VRPKPFSLFIWVSTRPAEIANQHISY
jgi:hypothetical protein